MVEVIFYFEICSLRVVLSNFIIFQSDLDEMSAEARLCEDKADKAMIDAARLADELRYEQESAQNLEKGHHFGQAQVKDMQVKLDEAETTALKGGKKAINKLDSRYVHTALIQNC